MKGTTIYLFQRVKKTTTKTMCNPKTTYTLTQDSIQFYSTSNIHQIDLAYTDNFAAHASMYMYYKCASKSAFLKAEKLQAKMLKSSLGLKSHSRNTPLLDALKIPRIQSTVQLQELFLLHSMFVSSSRAQHFYKHILSLYINGAPISNACVISRVIQTCDHNNLSLINVINVRFILQNFSRPTTVIVTF